MGEVVALALGIALSPFPVVPAILLLFTARPRTTALAFLCAWIAGIGVAVAVFVLLADRLGSGDGSPTWLAWVRIVAGTLLVGLGVRKWITRGASGSTPGWMQSIADATPTSAARLALLLSLANPKVVLLAAAGGADIGASGLSTTGEIAAVVLFTAVAASSVALPVLAFVTVGDPVLRPLGAAKDWLLRNTAATMAVVVVVLGLLLLKNGIAGL